MLQSSQMMFKERTFQTEALSQWLSGKELPAMQEMWVQSLGQEDPPEKAMATHSSTLTWEIPRTEEPAGLQSMGPQESWIRLTY